MIEPPGRRPVGTEAKLSIIMETRMRSKPIVPFLAILALILAPTVGLTCDKDKHAATAASAGAAGDTKPCCAKGAAGSGCAKGAGHAAELAKAAEGGCEKSTAELIAYAKESGCPHSAALAAKAEAGDAEAKATLIAMTRSMAGGEAEPSMVQLAKAAEHGCEKSKAALIARAKTSGSPEAAALAAKAEGGCAQSTEALVALVKTEGAGAAAH